jgi:hypothetical protein
MGNVVDINRFKINRELEQGIQKLKPVRVDFTKEKAFYDELDREENLRIQEVIIDLLEQQPWSKDVRQMCQLIEDTATRIQDLYE